MNLWRWLGTLALVAGCFIAFSSLELPVGAGGQEKDKDKDKGKVAKDKDAPAKDKDAPAKDKDKETPAKDKDKGTPTKDKDKETPTKDKDKGTPAKDKEKDKDGAKDKGTEVKAGDRLDWKAFDPKAKPFYQTLVTSTDQVMQVMTQKIEQHQKQTFYIKWTPKEKSKEGYWVVTQQIEGVQMNIEIGGNKISYDSEEKKEGGNPMTDFFKALMQLELTLTIDPATMTVKSIEGRDKFVKKLVETNPQMQGLLNSILSEDALKQMAEPTWGVFPTGDYKKPWERKSELNLGPIGTYITDFKYKYEGPDQTEKADKIGITASLEYKAPTISAGLPFTIKAAKLQSKEGTGVAYFDKEKGRFTKSKMSMKLSGSLDIDVAGMVTTVVLDQTQNAEVTTSDERPAALKSAPAK